MLTFFQPSEVYFCTSVSVPHSRKRAVLFHIMNLSNVVGKRMGLSYLAFDILTHFKNILKNAAVVWNWHPGHLFFIHTTHSFGSVNPE